MNTYTDNNGKHKSQSRSDANAQKKNRNGSTFQFVDNRPEATVQRKLKELADTSSQLSQLQSFQGKDDNKGYSRQLKAKKSATPTSADGVVQMIKYYRWTKDRTNVVECPEKAYRKSKLKATENDYFKYNERMKAQMAPITSRTYETVADQQANVGKGSRQRSGSVHVPTRNRSGSVDVRHYHDNVNSPAAARDESVGHIDRHGVRRGRPADPTSRTGAAPVTKPEGREELSAEDMDKIYT